jgi:serine/threonine-protein kinase HipA
MDLSDSVENEWCCLQILSAYGLTTNHSEIITFDSKKVLVIERFDRRWSQNSSVLLRLPQEDMCQALGAFSDLKYESDGGPGIQQIMSLLNGAFDAVADREHFMKSVFLFWVLGAIDGHAKNFSIFLEAGGRFRLTPLYDVMSAYPLIVKQQLMKKNMKMAMAVKGKNRHYRWLDIQLRHWFDTAAKCQFPESAMRRIIEEVFDEMDAVIDNVRKNLPKDFPRVISEAIFDNMQRVKLRAKMLPSHGKGSSLDHIVTHKSGK